MVSNLDKIAYQLWNFLRETYQVDVDIDDIKEIIRSALK